MLGTQRVTAIVRASQENVQQFDERIGFKKEGVVRHGYKNNEDLIVYGMLFEEFVEGDYAPKYEELDPSEIVPLHDAWNEGLNSELIESMEKNGWKGRPLVILRTDRNYALTGTHRRTAAIEAGIKVPVHFVDTQNLKDEMFINLLKSAGDHQSARYLQIELENFNNG